MADVLEALPDLGSLIEVLNKTNTTVAQQPIEQQGNRWDATRNLWIDPVYGNTFDPKEGRWRSPEGNVFHEGSWYDPTGANVFFEGAWLPVEQANLELNKRAAQEDLQRAESQTDLANLLSEHPEISASYQEGLLRGTIPSLFDVSTSPGAQELARQEQLAGYEQQALDEAGQQVTPTMLERLRQQRAAEGRTSATTGEFAKLAGLSLGALGLGLSLGAGAEAIAAAAAAAPGLTVPSVLTTGAKSFAAGTVASRLVKEVPGFELLPEQLQLAVRIAPYYVGSPWKLAALGTSGVVAGGAVAEEAGAPSIVGEFIGGFVGPGVPAIAGGLAKGPIRSLAAAQPYGKYASVEDLLRAAQQRKPVDFANLQKAVHDMGTNPTGMGRPALIQELDRLIQVRSATSPLVIQGALIRLVSDNGKIVVTDFDDVGKVIRAAFPDDPVYAAISDENAAKLLTNLSDQGILKITGKVGAWGIEAGDKAIKPGALGRIADDFVARVRKINEASKERLPEGVKPPEQKIKDIADEALKPSASKTRAELEALLINAGKEDAARVAAAQDAALESAANKIAPRQKITNVYDTSDLVGELAGAETALAARRAAAEKIFDLGGKPGAIPPAYPSFDDWVKDLPASWRKKNSLVKQQAAYETAKAESAVTDPFKGLVKEVTEGAKAEYAALAAKLPAISTDDVTRLGNLHTNQVRELGWEVARPAAMTGYINNLKRLTDKFAPGEFDDEFAALKDSITKKDWQLATAQAENVLIQLHHRMSGISGAEYPAIAATEKVVGKVTSKGITYKAIPESQAPKPAQVRARKIKQTVEEVSSNALPGESISATLAPDGTLNVGVVDETNALAKAIAKAKGSPTIASGTEPPLGAAGGKPPSGGRRPPSSGAIPPSGPREPTDWTQKPGGITSLTTEALKQAPGLVYDIIQAIPILMYMGLVSFDYSYPLRQGAIAIRHGLSVKYHTGEVDAFGKELLRIGGGGKAADIAGLTWGPWSRAFVSGAKALMNPKQIAVEGTPWHRLGQVFEGTTSGGGLNYSRAREAALEAEYGYTGLHISKTGVEGKLSQKEELFANFGSKLWGFKQSEAMATTFINELRGGLIDDYTKMLQRLTGHAFSSELAPYANYVNHMTGWASLPSWADSAPIIGLANQLLFSARRNLSLVQAPLHMFRSDGRVRVEAFKDFLAFFGFGSSILGSFVLADKAGILPESWKPEVSLDPTDANFGKLRIGGKTRLDVFAGYQQFARWFARSAEAVWDGDSDQFLRAASFFLRSKLAPVPGVAWDVFEQRDITGRPVDFDNFDDTMRYIWKHVGPLAVQDFAQAVKENGIKGGAVAWTSFFGFGSQTYETPTDESSRIVGEDIKSGKITQTKYIDADGKIRDVTKRRHLLPTVKGAFDERNSKATERRLEMMHGTFRIVQDTKAEFFGYQVENDKLLDTTSNLFNPVEWRRQRAELKQQEFNTIHGILKDNPPKPLKPETRMDVVNQMYQDIIKQNTNERRKVDWEGVDREIATWSDFERSLLADQRLAGETQASKNYISAVKLLEPYFKQRDQAYPEIVKKIRTPAIAEEYAQYKNIDELRQAKITELTKQGMAWSLAVAQVDKLLAPIDDAARDVAYKYLNEHRELVFLLDAWGFYVPSSFRPLLKR